jgi:hypothetical protein
MPAFTVGAYPYTLGAIIAILVLLLAILGLLNVIPFTATIVFGLIAALSIARLT